MVVQRRLEHAATAQSVVSASPLLPVPPAGNGCVLALWCCSTSMQRQYCHHWPGCWAGVWGLGAVVVQESGTLVASFCPAIGERRRVGLPLTPLDTTRPRNFTSAFENVLLTTARALDTVPAMLQWSKCKHFCHKWLRMDRTWTCIRIWAAGRGPRIYVFLVTGT